jgi:hypothetical protein
MNIHGFNVEWGDYQITHAGKESALFLKVDGEKQMIKTKPVKPESTLRKWVIDELKKKKELG